MEPDPSVDHAQFRMLGWVDLNLYDSESKGSLIIERSQASAFSKNLIEVKVSHCNNGEEQIRNTLQVVTI